MLGISPGSVCLHYMCVLMSAMETDVVLFWRVSVAYPIFFSTSLLRLVQQITTILFVASRDMLN